MTDGHYISIKESYHLCLQIAGDQAKNYQKTLLFYGLAFVTQGLAFGLFYPLIQAAVVLDFSKAFFWVGVILGLAAASIAAKWFAHSFDYTAQATQINHALRLKLGKKLRSMPLEKLYTYRTGDLNSILSSGVDESVLMMGFISGMILEAMIIPFMIILFSLFLDVKMGLILLFFLLVSLPLYRMQRKSNVKERIELRDAHQSLESNAIEYIQGMGVLKSLNRTGSNAQQLKNRIEEVKTIQEKGLFRSTFLMSAVNSLIEMAILATLSLGAYLVAGGTFSVAALITLIVWITRISEPLSNFMALASILDVMDTAFKAITGLLNVQDLEIQPQQAGHQKKSEEQSKAQSEVQSKLQSKAQDTGITFEQVDFTYAGTTSPALQNVSFTIPARSFTAIVGDSGSGKTTITRLIMRYSDVQKGCVKIGGMDVRQMQAKELMDKISVVFQDVYLFDDTILNNIRMANPNASDKEVITAANAAYCHEFIQRLPEGYDTVVGEIGGSLSGGEKQRISIARAILKNAPVVILDEPTSALDTQSEVAVQKALNTLVKDKTVIIIAHRLSTITGADQILVVEQGKITEQGTHEQLLKKKGKYKNMFEAQMRIKAWHIR